MREPLFSIGNDLVAINKQGMFPNLFFIHAASGLIFPYFKLKEIKTSIYAIGNPYYGHGNEFQSIHEMAKTYITFIKCIQPHGPYYLGGWSLGGVIAQEMACQLVNQAELVAQVIMIDSYNWDDRPNETLSQYRDAEKIIKQLKLKERSDEAALRQQYRNSYELLLKHKVQAYSGQVLLLKALYPEPPEDEASQSLQAWYERRQHDPYNGWKTVLSQLQVKGIHATHSEMFDVEYIDETIRGLENYLSDNK